MFSYPQGCGGAIQVAGHPFFDGLDWAQLSRAKHEAAFVPATSSDTDTSYFARRRFAPGGSSLRRSGSWRAGVSAASDGGGDECDADGTNDGGDECGAPRSGGALGSRGGDGGGGSRGGGGGGGGDPPGGPLAAANLFFANFSFKNLAQLATFNLENVLSATSALGSPPSDAAQQLMSPKRGDDKPSLKRGEDKPPDA